MRTEALHIVTERVVSSPNYPDGIRLSVQRSTRYHPPSHMCRWECFRCGVVGWFRICHTEEHKKTLRLARGHQCHDRPTV